MVITCKNVAFVNIPTPTANTLVPASRHALTPVNALAMVNQKIHRGRGAIGSLLFTAKQPIYALNESLRDYFFSIGAVTASNIQRCQRRQSVVFPPRVLSSRTKFDMITVKNGECARVR